MRGYKLKLPFTPIVICLSLETEQEFRDFQDLIQAIENGGKNEFMELSLKERQMLADVFSHFQKALKKQPEGNFSDF